MSDENVIQGEYSLKQKRMSNMEEVREDLNADIDLNRMEIRANQVDMVHLKQALSNSSDDQTKT